MSTNELVIDRRTRSGSNVRHTPILSRQTIRDYQGHHYGEDDRSCPAQRPHPQQDDEYAARRAQRHKARLERERKREIRRTLLKKTMVTFAILAVTTTAGHHLLDMAKTSTLDSLDNASERKVEAISSMSQTALEPIVVVNQDTAELNQIPPSATETLHTAPMPAVETKQDEADQARSQRIADFEGQYPDRAININNYSEDLETCYDYLQGTDRFTDAQIAGILGNAMQESHLDPHADNGFAYGAWQYEGPRRDELEQRPDYDTLQGQMAFMLHEFDTTESRAYDLLLETTTSEEAARSFCQYYERPGDPRERTRAYYADKIDEWHDQQAGTTNEA